MRLIQHYIPNPRHYAIHRIFVQASPEVAWDAARHFDGETIPWVKLLFSLRDIPQKLFGPKREHEPEKGLGIDQITNGQSGFMLLEEKPGSEIVVGAVGQFWHPVIPFKQVSPATFPLFNETGWGKVAWSITVDPYLDGSTITLELRVTATDDESWHKQQRYFTLIGPASHMIREALMHQLESRLRKMQFSDDDHCFFPGDDILPDARYSITFHKNIEAPPSMVWSYLMQMGCDRAGWYSIDAIDNDSRPSLDHINPQWPERFVGDKLSATPEMDGFFDVYQLEHEKLMTVGGETLRLGTPFKMSWSFILLPMGNDATHLISRARMIAEPKWKEWIMGHIVYPPVHWLMSAAQLKHIKHLAERDAMARITEEHVIHEN